MGLQTPARCLFSTHPVGTVPGTTVDGRDHLPRSPPFERLSVDQARVCRELSWRCLGAAAISPPSLGAGRETAVEPSGCKGLLGHPTVERVL